MFLRNLTPILSSALLFNAIPSLGLPMSMGQSENEQLTLRPSLFPTSSFESQEAFYPLKETLQEAAIHARQLIQYRSQGVGTLMSTYSLDHSDESLQGLPIGLQEYFAPYPNGDILLLALPISGIYHNINEDPEHSATIGIKDELATLQRNGSHWAANRRRISVFGKVQPVTEWEEAKALYERFHPDSRLWDGDDGPHSSAWVRLQVEKVFYFGGFGDRAAIGWLDMDLYREGFEDSPESEAEAVCFHPSGVNTYCDQPNEGDEEEAESVSYSHDSNIEQQDEEEAIPSEDDEDEDEEDEEDGDEEDEDEEEADEGDLILHDLLADQWAQWEDERQPVEETTVIQIINNHHHHHHYASVGSSESSDPITQAIEAAVEQMREELTEMADEMVEVATEIEEMIEEESDLIDTVIEMLEEAEVQLEEIQVEDE